MPRIRLSVLDTGLIECADFALFDPGLPPGSHGTMTVRSYLVEHPEGRLVWDAGLPEAYARRSERSPDETFRFEVATPMDAQLRAAGVEPDAVDVLALSHLHPDHVGNAALFGRATVLVQQAERDAAFAPDYALHQYDPETLAPLRPERLTVVSGDHDVFGDGSVVLKSWPGHSPGHQGLSVTLDRCGVIVLGADLAHSMRNFEREAVSPLNSDHEQSIASIRAAKEFIAEQAATLWLNHDVAQQATIDVVPASYA